MSKNRRQIDVDYSEGGAIMPTNRLHSNPDWKYAIATGFLVAAMVVPQFSEWVESQELVKSLQTKVGSLPTSTGAN